MVVPVAAHASGREIYRLVGAQISAIGSVNGNLKEWGAYCYLTNHFRSFGLNVAEVYATDENLGLLLVEDLGEATLLDVLHATRGQDGAVGPEVEALYDSAVRYLPKFQVVAGRSLDFQRCYPRSSFDVESMRWDMEYYREEFLYRYLVGSQAKFSALDLEADFGRLASFLSEAEASFFMYRDFQARNIVVKQGQCKFIDYELGRRGPLHYDIASLLYQSSARLSSELRVSLLESYIKALGEHLHVDRDEFYRFYDGFVLIRLLQVLGTYGKLGLGQGKQYFFDSIKPALVNVQERLGVSPLLSSLPTLRASFEEIISVERC